MSHRRLPGWLAALAPSGWSLRLRLVAGVAVLCAVGLAVTGTLGVAELRSYLLRQIDQQLAGLASQPRGPGQSEQSGQFPGGARGDAVPPDTDGDLPTPFVFAVLGADGAVVWQGGGSVQGDAPRPDLTGLDAAAVRARAGRPFTVPSLTGGPDFRVRVRPNDDGTANAVAISLRQSDDTVRRLETITVVVALVVLAVLIASAAVVVTVGLRPLRSVERTAESIAAGDLSRRIPPGRPRTEIGRLAATLNSMLGQIESAFLARENTEATLRQFIADASHELRTPLTTVRGYAELVNRGAVTEPGQRRHALERIEAEAARMGALVEDLLLLAYLDQQRPLQVSRADLTALVTDAVADARVRDRGRRIEHSGPGTAVPVQVDVDRMRQVLANLLSNALVHTPPDAAIRVGLAVADGRAAVSVADDGPGVAPEHQARLFERFYRADPSRTRARGGTGLGLSIVAAVVAASGGTVTCTSTPGAGATFTVTLPVAP